MGLEDLGENYINILLHYASEAKGNESVDFRKPYIRTSLKYVYPLFIFLHVGVALFGTLGNAAILYTVIKRGLYRNPTFFFLGNLALSDIIKAALVLPLTLANLLIQNWIFGSFLCFFLPMLHSFPTHASILTYMMIAVDRYRLIVHPMKSRVPAGLCAIAVWVVSVCVVLPYAVYMKYIDVGAILQDDIFQGLGICWVNQERHIEEYIRAMFITLYCLPLAITAFLYVKVSAEIKADETPSVTFHVEENVQSVSENSYHSRVTWSTSESDQRIEPEGASGDSNHARAYGLRRTAEENHHNSRHHHTHAHHNNRRMSQDSYIDEIDMRKEKRTQKYMIAMITLFAMCWCPVNILILVTHFVYENENNEGHFDITYLTFTFFGFLSTCINPVLVASWRMSDRTKDRLKGYFRFSNRRRSSGHSAVSRTTEIYAPTHTPSPKDVNSCGVNMINKSYV